MKLILVALFAVLSCKPLHRQEEVSNVKIVKGIKKALEQLVNLGKLNKKSVSHYVPLFKEIPSNQLNKLGDGLKDLDEMDWLAFRLLSRDSKTISVARRLTPEHYEALKIRMRLDGGENMKLTDKHKELFDGWSHEDGNIAKNLYGIRNIIRSLTPEDWSTYDSLTEILGFERVRRVLLDFELNDFTKVISPTH